MRRREVSDVKKGGNCDNGLGAPVAACASLVLACDILAGPLPSRKWRNW